MHRVAARLRFLAIASSPLLALGLAGCHNNTHAAYPPPPPPMAKTAPANDTAVAERPATRPPAPSPATPSTPAVAPASPLEPRGKPVSSEVGLASWYGPPYTNRKAADGSIYDQNAMTAAHRTLPMGSMVRVTNLANEQSVVVRITDRGPFVNGRIIDLSLAAAKLTGIYRAGVAKVRVEAYAPPDRPGMDPAGRWCVQIGVFLDQAEAIRLKNELTRQYATAKVIEFAGPTGHWVRINPLKADRATADQIAESIHIPDPRAQPYLVRLN